jgi:phosphate transport system protein
MEMGKLAQNQIASAVDAFVQNKPSLAQQVINLDKWVDAQQTEIEIQAIATIARRQPFAVDLRTLIALLRTARELERIGDLAKNIAKRALALGSRARMPPTSQFVSLSEKVLDQMHDLVQSLSSRDGAKAFAVWERDSEVDGLYTMVFHDVTTVAMEDPRLIGNSVHMLFCAKNLERIGDHVTNIAEAVFYMVAGRSLPDECRPRADRTTDVRLDRYDRQYRNVSPSIPTWTQRSPL